MTLPLLPLQTLALGRRPVNAALFAALLRVTEHRLAPRCEPAHRVLAFVNGVAKRNKGCGVKWRAK
jgi:hypothetical protein